MLTSDQLQDILTILDRQLTLFIATTIGEDGLSDRDKKTLKASGVDYNKLYKQGKDLITLNYQLGLLSNLLSQKMIKKMTGQQLIKYIESGQHIPLNERERETVRGIKMQSLADIRSNGAKIFQDINRVVQNVFGSHRANQQEFIRDTIAEGTAKRQSIKTIAKTISRLTGDWSRNFSKSVVYISHTALNEGRAAAIARRYEDSSEAKIYFQVQKDACPKCKQLYLDDKGEPIIFTLKELQVNGTNIGRKQADWKPTLGALHVHCRCLATEYIEGQEWREGRYMWPTNKKGESIERKPTIKRKLIRVLINGVEHFV